MHCDQELNFCPSLFALLFTIWIDVNLITADHDCISLTIYIYNLYMSSTEYVL